MIKGGGHGYSKITTIQYKTFSDHHKNILPFKFKTSFSLKHIIDFLNIFAYTNKLNKKVFEFEDQSKLHKKECFEINIKDFDYENHTTQFSDLFTAVLIDIDDDKLILFDLDEINEMNNEDKTRFSAKITTILKDFLQRLYNKLHRENMYNTVSGHAFKRKYVTID